MNKFYQTTTQMCLGWLNRIIQLMSSISEELQDNEETININSLPANISNNIKEFCNSLNIGLNKIKFWHVSNYGVFVSMRESFYKSLNFRREDPIVFLQKRKNNALKSDEPYPDSRNYIEPIIDHLKLTTQIPIIIDIGGYIGRFSIESALMLRERGIFSRIYCFEPGLTCPLIKANIAINDVADEVELVENAVASHENLVDFYYAKHVLISGRLGSFSKATHCFKVNAIRMDRFIRAKGISEPILVKIDTEGYEPDVFEGFGSIIQNYQGVYIVEFWPLCLKQKVNGKLYGDFLEENFILFDIRNSLYPKRYVRIKSIHAFAKQISSEKGQVDILCLSKLISRVEELANKIEVLGK